VTDTEDQRTALDLEPAEALVRISFLVQSLYTQVATAHDLTAQQAQLLCMVKDGPRAMGDLVAMLRIDKSSVSGLVDRVGQRGLVTRTRSQTDGRAVTVALTIDGKRRAEAFYAETSARLEEVVALLAPDHRSTLATLLSEIVGACAVPPVFGDHALVPSTPRPEGPDP